MPTMSAVAHVGAHAEHYHIITTLRPPTSAIPCRVIAGDETAAPLDLCCSHSASSVSIPLPALAKSCSSVVSKERSGGETLMFCNSPFEKVKMRRGPSLVYPPQVVKGEMVRTRERRVESSIPAAALRISTRVSRNSDDACLQQTGSSMRDARHHMCMCTPLSTYLLVQKCPHHLLLHHAQVGRGRPRAGRLRARRTRRSCCLRSCAS